MSSLVTATSGPLRLHRFCLPRFQGSHRSCCALQLRVPLGSSSSSFASSVLVLRPFAPSGFHRLSSLLRPLLSSFPLSRKRSPQVRSTIFPLVPSGSTCCVLMTFGLRCH